MPYCSRCYKQFYSWSSYDHHVAHSPDHHICEECNMDFPTYAGLKEHWVQSPRHNYCQYCDQHVEDIIRHFSQYHHYCQSCVQVFKSAFGLHEHYRQSECHRNQYCVECRRLFPSTNNLIIHLNSSVHKSKDVKCPTGCGSSFVSRSALVLHLENGACTSGLNRATINRYIREYDRNNLITDPARMIAGPSGVEENVRLIATERSWNGALGAWQCCLCYSTFRLQNALNQHLASPRHQDKIYVCRGAQCNTRFPSLSGLVQHIESNKCGFSKLQIVQDTMDSMLGQMARITL